MHLNIKAITVFIIMLVYNSAHSQKQNIELELNDKKVDYFIKLEKKLGSKPYESNSDYISPGDVAQPVIFRRKENNIPDLLVYYTFRKSDSIVTTIEYEWDIYNFEKEDNNKKSPEFEKNLISKYNEVVSFISAKYGKGETKGNLDDLSKINSPEGLKRGDNWKPTDSLEIDMYTTISNYYSKNGMVTTNPTHRIRVYIYNFKGSKPKKISEEQLAILNDTFEKFKSMLAENNLEKTKLLLSEKIRAQVTDEILSQIKTQLESNRKFKLFTNGLQLMQDGNTYPMLQYKYADDTDSPPKEYITVLFDKDNTILGLQPFKRK